MLRTQFIKKMRDKSRWPAWAQRLFHYSHIYLRDAKRSELSRQASAMSFVTLFSLIPSIAAIFTLLGIILPMLGEQNNLMHETRQFILRNLASGASTQVVDYLQKLLATFRLKKIGITALIGLMITLAVLLRQIEQAFNRIWMLSHARPALKRFIFFWLCLLVGTSIGSLIVGLRTRDSIVKMITRETLAVADRADNIPVVAISFNWLITCFVFYLIYKIVPNCPVRSRFARTGALFAGTAFFVLGKGYKFYVVSFANYKTIYGTLSAVPVFMTWIYVSWLILLAGALLAWRSQNGWPALDDDNSLESTTTAQEDQRNLHIQSMLPALALLSIYRQFQLGKTVDTMSVVEELKLPYGWVHNSIEFLRELKLVDWVSSEQESPKGQEQLEPSQPADQISLDALNTMTAAPFTGWASDWMDGQPSHMSALIKKLTEYSRTSGDCTLDTLLEKTT